MKPWVVVIVGSSKDVDPRVVGPFESKVYADAVAAYMTNAVVCKLVTP